MRRIFAQTRKELTQIGSRLAHACDSRWCCPLVLLLLMSTAISLTVNRFADRRAGPRRLAGFPRLHRRFPRVRYVLCRHLSPVDRTPGKGSYLEHGACGADHARTLRPRHGARSQLRPYSCSSTPPTPIRRSWFRAMRARLREHTTSAREAVQRIQLFRRRSASGTTLAAHRRNSMDLEFSFWDSPCFRLCWRRLRWQRKESRKPFCRSTSPASPRMNSCSERSSRSWSSL